MRFFCDTAWNHKNVHSKIAQKTGKILQVYFRHVKELNCAYCRQFTYSYDNNFSAGFDGQIIY